MKCCACSNPPADDHPKAPLCLRCLESWREFEDSPRITQPLEDLPYSDRDRQLKVHIFSVEFDRELTQRDPELAWRIRVALAGGDAGFKQLGECLTEEQARFGFVCLLLAQARCVSPKSEAAGGVLGTASGHSACG